MRRFVEAELRRHGVDPWAAVLAASELATNVTKHARTPYTVGVIVTDEAVRLEVRDGAGAAKVAKKLTEDESGGWGLRIIDRLATDWGVDYGQEGKTVWIDIAPEHATD